MARAARLRRQLKIAVGSIEERLAPLRERVATSGRHGQRPSGASGVRRPILRVESAHITHVTSCQTLNLNPFVRCVSVRSVCPVAGRSRPMLLM